MAQDVLRDEGASIPAAARVAVARSSGRVVVTVGGNLTVNDVQYLDALLVDLIDNQGNLRVIVDLRDIDASGTSPGRILIDAWRRLRRRGGELVLTGRTDRLALRAPVEIEIADTGLPAVS